MMAYISRLKLLRNTIKDINSRFKNINEKVPDETIHQNCKENIIIITERSLFTDKMVFAKMLYDTEKIEYINYQIYLNWFDTFIEEFPVHKIIYVRARPETCHQRIEERNRNGENNIPIEYLKSCNEYHENMLDKNSPDCICECHLILDGENNIYKNTDILSNWIYMIEKFIYN
jgi:deoxycitidine kinase/deoxyguanosine kinase